MKEKGKNLSNRGRNGHFLLRKLLKHPAKIKPLLITITISCKFERKSATHHQVDRKILPGLLQ